MAQKGKWPGTWSVICDVCGFRFPSDQIKKRWDNLMVDQKCWEQRHPQDFIRGVPDRPAPPFTRPDPPNEFEFVCTIWGSSSYADLAEADCAHADQVTPTYAFLLSILANDDIPAPTFAPVGADGEEINGFVIDG